MIEVGLDCRNCGQHVHFASEFEPGEHELEDTQEHMDKMFVARCGSCFDKDWEVTDVKHIESKHGTHRVYAV